MKIHEKARDYMTWVKDIRLDNPSGLELAEVELASVLADVRAATILECNMRLTRMGLEEEPS